MGRLPSPSLEKSRFYEYANVFVSFTVKSALRFCELVASGFDVKLVSAEYWTKMFPQRAQREHENSLIVSDCAHMSSCNIQQTEKLSSVCRRQFSLHGHELAVCFHVTQQHSQRSPSVCAEYSGCDSTGLDSQQQLAAKCRPEANIRSRISDDRRQRLQGSAESDTD